MKLYLIVFSFLSFAISLSSQPENRELTSSLPVYTPAEKTIFYKLGDRSIPIRIFQYGGVKDIVYISLHSNEATAVQAATSVLGTKAGTLIKIENGNKRVIRFRLRGIVYGFDPNCIFSRIGIEQTLKENGRTGPQAIDEIEKFAQRLLMLIPEKTSCLIALHNNTDGGYSVKSYLPEGDRKFDAKAVYANRMQDADDIAFTTDSTLFQKMANNGYNAIWQDNMNVRRDGSLSVYCGERNIRYINIETQHGKIEQYAGMLGKLLLILANENISAEENNHDLQQPGRDLQKTVDN